VKRLWKLLRMDTDEFEARYPGIATLIAGAMAMVIVLGMLLGVGVAVGGGW